MKKAFLLSGLVLFLLTGSQIVYAQNLQEVLDRHFEAIGQDKLLKTETQSIDMTVEQMGMKIPMTMKIKRPDKFRMEMEVQGQKMIQVYNGEKGWMIAPWIGTDPQEITGAELNQAMDQANYDGELYNYKDKGSEATLIGKVNVEGTPMFNIRLTGKDGTVKNYFIDAGDYLVKRVKSTIEAQGQKIEIEQKINGYTDVNGIKMPTKMETTNPMGTATITFDKVTIDEKMDDSIFQKP